LQTWRNGWRPWQKRFLRPWQSLLAL
jgi:hypothetical protein